MRAEGKGPLWLLSLCRTSNQLGSSQVDIAENKVLVRSEIKSKKPRTALFVRGFSVAARHKVQEATNHIPHHRATQTDVM